MRSFFALLSMQILPDSEESLKKAFEVLEQGGVIAHATETCYGLACDMTNPNAVAKLFAIKQRAEDQPVSALFASIDDAKKYVEWNAEAQKLADKHLPGPLTMILNKQDAVPTLFTVPQRKTKNEKRKTVGIRLSSHPLAQQLASQFGRPLSTTSANLHSKPNPYSAQEILDQFSKEQEQPDLILDSGTLPKAEPSTVIDLSREERQIIREGDLLFSET